MRVNYDFTASTATRTAGLASVEPFELPGQPRKLSWWILSDGNGQWTSATIVDAAGQSTNLYGRYLTEPGWTRIEVDVPAAGVQYPVRLASLRVIEHQGVAVLNGLGGLGRPRGRDPALHRQDGGPSRRSSHGGSALMCAGPAVLDRERRHG